MASTAAGVPVEMLESLHEKSLKELQDLAKSLGIKGIAGLKKQTVADRIKAFAGLPVEGAPAQPPADAHVSISPPGQSPSFDQAPETDTAPGFTFKIVSKEEIAVTDGRQTAHRGRRGPAKKTVESVQPELFSSPDFPHAPLADNPSPVVTPLEEIQLPEKTSLRHEKYRRKPRIAPAELKTEAEEAVKVPSSEVAEGTPPAATGEPAVLTEAEQEAIDERKRKQRFRRREKLNPDQIDTEQFPVDEPAVVATQPKPQNRPAHNAQQQQRQQPPAGRQQQPFQPAQPAGPRPEPWAQYNIPDVEEKDLTKRIALLTPQIGTLFFVEGVLDIQPERFGLLRSLNYYYQSSPDDVYVSPALINRFKLRQGDTVVAICRAPKVGERYFGAVKVEGINGLVPDAQLVRKDFETLLPVYPDQRIRLEHSRSDYVTRVIDLFAPAGRGQRAMIVAQPKTGKTTILRRIANAVHENHPEMKILVLLVDERPEEVTEMERTAPGSEVAASTFDQKPENHVYLAELVFEKAKRLVEAGHHVLILLDSITRLARAYNAKAGNNGRTMSGGIDSQALKKPRQLFSGARNIEGGGSLTIIATALVDTGSRMDDVIFEEFKGTGNMEIVLDRRLANNRIFPAIDVFKSGTRREDLFVKEDEREKVALLRRYLNVMTTTEAMEFLLDKIKGTRDNNDFLMSMNREGR